MQFPFFEKGLNIWDPWRDLRKFRTDMDRILKQYSPERYEVPQEFPAVNIWSNDETATVTAELPGLVPDDIELSIQADQLTIRGKRGTHECVEGEVYHRRERGFGDFIRTIGLPFIVDADKIEAVYNNGILTVTLPRAESDKPKQISIKASKK